MKRLIIISLSLIVTILTMNAQERTVKLRIVETSDVHGFLFPTDYITGKRIFGTMARVSSYVKRKREDYGKNLILLDNGDILQGQPTNYYWNFIKTGEENIVSSVCNYMKYDAMAFGNHDIETGHACYDKWIKETNCPILAANVINTKTNKPYTKAYEIFERDGVRIAVLGLLTPAIPNWLSNDLWEGLEFEDMVSSAKKWIKVIQEEEKADVVIGLFHSGREGGITTPEYEENAVREIAATVKGFDVIMYGHDHVACTEDIRCIEGSLTLIINPGNNARRIGEAEVTITLNAEGKMTNKRVQGRLVSMDPESIDQEYMSMFKSHLDNLTAYTSQKIGKIATTIYSRDSFFGSAPFSDLIHNIQLSLTKADISFNAPLHFDAAINEGDITVADMFNLYKFENKLYVVRMKGCEIRKHLEMSYALWTNTMQSADDYIMQMSDTNSDSERHGFLNPYFNFDSAAGIDYEVDVTKPEGEKVKIIKMSNGKPFSEDEWYNVAMSSYRANGGGELITRGAGIPKDSIDSRIIYRSELDQRHYIMEEIKKQGTINPKANNNWKFVPEAWTKPALERDYKLIFHKLHNNEYRVR